MKQSLIIAALLAAAFTLPAHAASYATATQAKQSQPDQVAKGGGKHKGGSKSSKKA